MQATVRKDLPTSREAQLLFIPLFLRGKVRVDEKIICGRTDSTFLLNPESYQNSSESMHSGTVGGSKSRRTISRTLHTRNYGLKH
jgi:hypothetical protein